MIAKKKKLKVTAPIYSVFKTSILIVFLFFSNVSNSIENPKQDRLNFSVGENGSFIFDTGLLKGILRKDGKSNGLVPVTFGVDSLQVSKGEGLYNHYRVFTEGKRYGYGARRWASTATLLSDGSVEVHWEATNDRPFVLRANYRLHTPNTIDVITTVEAHKDLTNFEVFIASYFSSGFTDSRVSAIVDLGGKKGESLESAKREFGNWQAFPRDMEAEKIINDGRWNLGSSPLDWSIRSNYALPLAIRRNNETGITVLMMAKKEDCFGIFTPYAEEKHFSTYMSLFGDTIEKGKKAVAHTRLVVLKNPSELKILKIVDEYENNFRREKQ